MSFLQYCPACFDCDIPIPVVAFNECVNVNTGGLSYIFLSPIGSPLAASPTDSNALLAELQARINNLATTDAMTIRALKVINATMPAPSETTIPAQGCYPAITTSREQTIVFSLLELTQENLDFQAKTECPTGVKALLWAIDDNCVFFGGQSGVPVTIKGVHTFAGSGKTDLQTLDFTATWTGCSPQRTITTISACAENFAFSTPAP